MNVRHPILLSLILAASLSACKKKEATAPEPVPEAPPAEPVRV